MNSRSFTLVAKWIAAGLLYIAFSFWVVSLFVGRMHAWADAAGASRYVQWQIRFLRFRIFDLCILWGALYAAPFAKPDSFGRPLRIWMHLACSYVLGLLAIAGSIWALLLPLPNWRSDRLLYEWLTLRFTLAAVCFVTAIAAWVHLAFGKLKANADPSALSQDDMH